MKYIVYKNIEQISRENTNLKKMKMKMLLEKDSKPNLLRFRDL